MKFVCLKCETYMTFEKVEKPAEGSLGVFFECPSCQSRFSMVTNPGETQMVSSLGVQLGGRTEAPKPLEMTRGGLEDNVSAGMGQMAAYLNEKIQGGQPAAAPRLQPLLQLRLVPVHQAPLLKAADVPFRPWLPKWVWAQPVPQAPRLLQLANN